MRNDPGGRVKEDGSLAEPVGLIGLLIKPIGRFSLDVCMGSDVIHSDGIVRGNEYQS